MTKEKFLEYLKHNKKVDPTRFVSYVSIGLFESLKPFLPESVLKQVHVNIERYVEDFEDTRTAIKTQQDPGLLPYSDQEQSLIKRYESLDRSCKRVIERHAPKSWQVLDLHLKEHEQSGHNRHKH